MKTALIGMGSNINPEKHFKSAMPELRQRFLSVTCSSVYQSAAVGMEGDDFLNACLLLEGVPECKELIRWLKGLEDQHGRDRSAGSWKPRTLDLDVMMYDGELLDDDVYRYAHAFVPASELVTLGHQPAELDTSQLKKVAIQL